MSHYDDSLSVPTREIFARISERQEQLEFDRIGARPEPLDDKWEKLLQAEESSRDPKSTNSCRLFNPDLGCCTHPHADHGPQGCQAFILARLLEHLTNRST